MPAAQTASRLEQRLLSQPLEQPCSKRWQPATTTIPVSDGSTWAAGAGEVVRPEYEDGDRFPWPTSGAFQWLVRTIMVVVLRH